MRTRNKAPSLLLISYLCEFFRSYYVGLSDARFPFFFCRVFDFVRYHVVVSSHSSYIILFYSSG